MLDRDALRATLETMADASPGPDGITPADLLLMGRGVLDTLCVDLQEGRYQPGGETTYQVSKADGGYRRLNIGNVVDRLLQKRAAHLLTPCIDHFLTEACYAYRKGFGRERALAALRGALASGYRHGIKADIQAFFDTVSRPRLWSLLTALFPREPLLDLLVNWLPAAPGKRGLPQGNPLSPMLSNLYLEAFDTALQRRGLKLIRYADDFVLLSREPLAPETLQEWVTAALGPLKLTVAPHKTQAIKPGQAWVFLGYQVTDGEAVEKRAVPDEAQWYPVQQSPSLRGQVVYLTARHHSTYNHGGNLVITTVQGRHTAIPWASIRTIVNIGRHRLSGSVLRRALNQKVPVFFQKLLGGMEGMLVPQPGLHQAPLIVLQQQRFSEEATCLAWARGILAAKICNRAVVLKRHGIDPGFRKTAVVQRLEKAGDAAALRGVEGHYAAAYFAAFAQLVDPFRFTHRVYRPPDGPVNAMLSLAYMLLYHRVNAALIRAGLDSRHGFFHEGRGSHAALASDMMEELRFLADRTVVAVIRMGMIQPDDFEPDQRGQRARLTQKAFSVFVKRFEHVLAGTFQNDKTGKPQDYNAYIEDMAGKVGAALKLGVIYEPRWMR
ncbi:CRISPR-associated endonuclease Cas1 [Acanthopleuribacter pedis]|uniref:CRISPR-associated endonuclease Cas1 n=1 Tax=Acanthopleuribacter pedis TaxID=442870 RepID=A0A8J7QA99_9BACT|nr:CRISPR-associated endonuclease Cas1 [Acanthopleuribacter pedis]MBO1320334.1 CRISPR-associated endonuclease Cas1 [Acanthopleuribacter pedis]